ncbi:MAG: aspartate aminotransferase family protein [Coriobacteriales bacterium]|jgi:acetylornithine/N-succinyldiaminopimelate aminotransferase
MTDKREYSVDREIFLEKRYVMGTYGRKPVEFVEGHGMMLYDSDSREYLDFLGGIAVMCLGHSHPAVVGAVQDQASRLMHTSNYFFADGRGELAEAISGLLNEGSDSPEDYKTFFTNSGTESNEGAFKLARRYAAKQGSEAKTILYLENSFHGRTLASLAATGQASKQEAFEPLPGNFAQIKRNDIDSFLEAVGKPGAEGVCAVIVECIQGESGVWPCSIEFLQQLRAETEKRGILLIVDEVQTGFFRCGSHPFAFQRAGIVPDIVSMAKGIACGFPMGAFAARAEVADAFVPGDHGSTFGGNPLAVAAANATISTLVAEKLGDNAEEVGAYMTAKLEELTFVHRVRGAGLMIGAQLEFPIAKFVVDRALQEGLVINATNDDTLRFLPPLICDKQDVDEMIRKLDTSYRDIYRRTYR